MESLDDLRTEIDRIDSQIASLLLERASYVKKVGERKAARNLQKSFIRSGREATMVRKLVDHLKFLYHPAATLAIWRTIISSSLSMEQPMNIASYVSPENDTSFWLAREYFGAFSAIRAAAALTPDDPSIAYEAGNIAAAAGNMDDAKAAWTRAAQAAADSDAGQAAALALKGETIQR